MSPNHSTGRPGARRRYTPSKRLIRDERGRGAAASFSLISSAWRSYETALRCATLGTFTRGSGIPLWRMRYSRCAWGRWRALPPRRAVRLAALRQHRRSCSSLRQVRRPHGHRNFGIQPRSIESPCADDPTRAGLCRDYRQCGFYYCDGGWQSPDFESILSPHFLPSPSLPRSPASHATSTSSRSPARTTFPSSWTTPSAGACGWLARALDLGDTVVPSATKCIDCRWGAYALLPATNTAPCTPYHPPRCTPEPIGLSSASENAGNLLDDASDKFCLRSG